MSDVKSGTQELKKNDKSFKNNKKTNDVIEGGAMHFLNLSIIYFSRLETELRLHALNQSQKPMIMPHFIDLALGHLGLGWLGIQWLTEFLYTPTNQSNRLQGMI